MSTENQHQTENLGTQIDWDKLNTLDTENESENRSDETEDKKDEETQDETSATEEKSDSAADDSNKQEEVVNTPQNDSFDINKYLAEKSEGLFMTEDDFKNSIIKVKEFDSLKTELEQVKVEKDNLFANPFMKTLNEMHKANATKEQIEQFTNLYNLGDVSKLEPKEALIQSLIRQGTVRSVAERMVERKYNLDLSLDEEVLSADEVARNKETLELAQEQMRIDAQPILKEFKETFDSLMETKNVDDIKLEKAAAEKKYIDALQEPAKKLADSIPEKFKVGDLTFDRSETFRKDVQEDFVEYFKDRKVDNESVKEFYEMQEAIFLQQNFPKIKDAIEKDAFNRGKKEAESAFENNSGLPRENAHVLNNSDKEALDKFMGEIATE